MQTDDEHKDDLTFEEQVEAFEKYGGMSDEEFLQWLNIPDPEQEEQNMLMIKANLEKLYRT